MNSMFGKPPRSGDLPVTERATVLRSRIVDGRKVVDVFTDTSREYEDVQLFVPARGQRSGHSPAAPADGATGFILHIGGKAMRGTGIVWLSASDVVGQAVMDEEVYDETSLHPSGSGSIRKYNGDYTEWAANGDYSFSGTGEPKRPQIRNEDGSVSNAGATPTGINRFFEWAKTKAAQWKVAKDLVFLLDGINRKIVLGISQTAIVLEEGRITLSDKVRVGLNPRAVALAEPTQVTLQALSEELQAVKTQLATLTDTYNTLLTSYTTHTHTETGITTLTPLVPTTASPLTPLITVNPNGVEVQSIGSENLYAE